MNKWEYRYEALPDHGNLKEELDVLGASGWELVAVTCELAATGKPRTWHAFLKRPSPPQPG